MSRRTFEMHHYEVVLTQIRSGKSDREIAKLGLMGRGKCAEPRNAGSGGFDPYECAAVRPGPCTIHPSRHDGRRRCDAGIEPVYVLPEQSVE